jgi:4-amino-4-deoxychorismate lyase
VAASSPRPTDQPSAVLVRLGPEGPALLQSRTPFLRADDLGVLRGDGVFERFLVNAGQPRHLEDHLVRLARSAGSIGLDLPSPAAWREAVAAGIAAWLGGPEWEMRLVCTRGPEEGGQPTAYVLGQELSPRLLRQRADGVSVVTISRGLPSGLVEEAPWLLLGAKTLSYAVNLAAVRWAESRGADDAIFVGTDGIVWEAGTSAVVACFGRSRLVSPPVSVGVLASISVARLFEAAEASGWEVAREDLSIDDLFGADGLWLCSSLRLSRVHTLDGKGLPPAAAHEEIAALAASC